MYRFLLYSQDEAPYAIKKFKDPDTGLFMVLVDYGGVTEFMTRVLFLTDKTGSILDKLEVQIRNLDFPVRQYEITSKGEVIVYRIIPTDGSIKFKDIDGIESFSGNRRDETYKAENGKFVLQNTVDYVTNTYYIKTLQKRNYYIWTGHERPSSTKVLNIRTCFEMINFFSYESFSVF